MSDQILRYGIVGVGLMGREHIRILALIPNVEVAAFYDPDQTSRTQASELIPTAKSYDDFDSFCKRDDIDALIISSPNHTHAEMLPKLIQNNQHILIEKPLATSIKDAKMISDLLHNYPGVVWTGMEYRYAPPVSYAINEAHLGTIGQIHMVSIREHRHPFLPKIGDWNRFNRNTGGTLVEKCCHFFDLMRFILHSDPVSVFGSGSIGLNHKNERYHSETPDILDNAFVIVDFDSGARAMLDLCMFAEQSTEQTEIQIIGEAGKIECRQPSATVTIGRREASWPNWKLGDYRNPGQIEKIKVPIEANIALGHGGATYYEHLAFIEAILNNQPPQVTVDDGLWSVAMGLAAEKSVQEKRVVEIEEILQ
jgi:myo-inositol 2-dehydrogenase/D-chiro-inositol 1-dehydrogenase